MAQLAQGSTAWQEWRRGGYGASDAPVLAEGDERAWQVLHGIKLGLLPDPEASEPMEWGLRLEDVIARRYAEQEGEPVERRALLVQHPDLPFVRASLDRRTKRGRKIVEIKAWSYRTDAFGPDGSDQVPLRMVYQVQQQLAASGYERADIAVFFGASKTLGVFKLSADRALIDELLGLEQAAWGYVERGLMPPWPGPAPERPTLLADEAPADDEVLALVASHELLREAAEVSEAALEECRNSLRLVLARHGGTRGTLADGRRFSVSFRPNKPSLRVGWDLVAAAYRKRLVEAGVPEAELDPLVSLYTTTAATVRPLKVTIAKAAQPHPEEFDATPPEPSLTT